MTPPRSRFPSLLFDKMTISSFCQTGKWVSNNTAHITRCESKIYFAPVTCPNLARTGCLGDHLFFRNRQDSGIYFGGPRDPPSWGGGYPPPPIPKKGVPGPPKMTKRYPFLKIWGALGPAVWGHGVTPYPGQKGGGTPPFWPKMPKMTKMTIFCHFLKNGGP